MSPGKLSSTRIVFAYCLCERVRGCIANPLERVTLVIIMIFRHGVVFIPSGRPPLSPLLAPTCTHLRSEPPRGLGRGRVCSIDRRRFTNLTERVRTATWKGTVYHPVACHPSFSSLLFSSTLTPVDSPRWPPTSRLFGRFTGRETQKCIRRNEG